MARTLVLLWCVLASAAWAQMPDPQRAWRTAETAHFRLHFEEEARASAQHVADLAERAHRLLARELSWTPKDKVDLVLYSGVDVPNGFATPLPFNRSGIVLAAPTQGELLDRGAWLELVLLHELTHIYHLDKAHGPPAALRQVFGRQVWTFPNALQPPWLIEGLAVLSESRAGAGVGRLHGPMFEAQLRDERQRGFMDLRELNANGRRLPMNRNYLYGAYFFDYLTRTYGPEAAARHVEWYSAQLIPFRVHNSTVAVTQKQMDVVWGEFLVDLKARVDERAAPLLAQPQQLGSPVGAPWRQLDAMAMGRDGTLYVVAGDGIGPPTLWRYVLGSTKPRALTALHPMARIDVRTDGAVLIAQPEVCGGYEVLYDVYQWSAQGGLQRLTQCQRYYRAVWVGDSGRVLALRVDRAGQTHVDLLETGARSARVLLGPTGDVQWLDVAVAPEGRDAVLLAKSQGVFKLMRLDLTTGATTLLHADAQWMSHPHVDAHGAVSFVSAHDGVPNVWRLREGRLQRLTHAHTAVLHSGGVSEQGTLALGVLRHGEVQVHVLTPTLDESAPHVVEAQLDPSTVPTAPVLLPATTSPANLEAQRDYSPLPSLRPRAWWPVLFADRGTFNVGASVFGADALGLHSYLMTPYVEVTQGEALGSAEYAWRNRHFVALQRELKVRRWVDRNGNEDPLEYERVSHAQWVSLARWVHLERDAALGLGAATSRRDGVVVDGATTRELDTRLAAIVAQYDSRRGGVMSEGPSRGQRLQVFYETYRPFKDLQRSPYDGQVLRLAWEGYHALGRSVMAAQWVEARGQAGRTENFTLGGEASAFETLAPQLDERDVSLRGYARGVGVAAQARRLSLEWRTPVADIDRHAMVPPVGVNRLSATVFFEAGGAWNHGGGPERWLRAVGVEAITEVRLGYLLPLRARLGVARGLDSPGQTRTYLSLGRAF